MATLFEIENELQARILDWEGLQEAGENISDDALRQELEHLQLTKEQKLQSYCGIIKNWQYDQAACEEESKRLREKAKILENKIERLKNILLWLYGPTFKWTNGVHKISVLESEETIITNEELVPDAYMRTKVTKSPDKTLIKSVLRQPDGIVPGAELKKNLNVQIK